MTLKEKLALIAKTRQENAKRLMAWLKEREKGRKTMADMVQINEDTLARAAFYLNDKYVGYLSKASKASKPERKNKCMAKARELKVLLDEICAVLDPKE